MEQEPLWWHMPRPQVHEGQFRFHLPKRAVIRGVEAILHTAPKGSDTIVDVNTNGHSIWSSSDRLRVKSGDVRGRGPADHAVPPHGYITIDVDQVGAEYPGKDLVVTVQVGRLSFAQWVWKRIKQVVARVR